MAAALAPTDASCASAVDPADPFVRRIRRQLGHSDFRVLDILIPRHSSTSQPTPIDISWASPDGPGPVPQVFTFYGSYVATKPSRKGKDTITFFNNFFAEKNPRSQFEKVSYEGPKPTFFMHQEKEEKYCCPILETVIYYEPNPQILITRRRPKPTEVHVKIVWAIKPHDRKFDEFGPTINQHLQNITDYYRCTTVSIQPGCLRSEDIPVQLPWKEDYHAAFTFIFFGFSISFSEQKRLRETFWILENFLKDCTENHCLARAKLRCDGRSALHLNPVPLALTLRRSNMPTNPTFGFSREKLDSAEATVRIYWSFQSRVEEFEVDQDCEEVLKMFAKLNITPHS